MNIKSYLDSTYLKTAIQANLSEKDNKKVVEEFIQEAIDESFKLVMIRPEYVEMAHKMIVGASSKTLVGTVIDFPEGNSDLNEKLAEAQKAISNNADELDFVINYEAFKNEEIQNIKNEIIACAKLCLNNKKTIKFIIEVAALNNKQIIQISTLIKNTVITNFKEDTYANIFVKSSTGFYQTKDNLPNGATKESIIMMIENASPLPVKASGGIRNLDDALDMIRLGVKRIGTSAAKDIVNGNISNEKY